MINPFSRLYQNAQLFPRLALLAAAVYLVIGLSVGIPLGITHHSLKYGASATILVLAAIGLTEFTIYYLISLSPTFFRRCEAAVDAGYRAFMRDPNEPREFSTDQIEEIRWEESE